MRRENVKNKFEIDGYTFYKTKKTIRKAKTGTTDKSIIVTHDEFMEAWNNHFDLYYA